MNQVLRFERKYLLPQEEYRKHRARISAVLAKDAHTGANGYPIRSLYFDSLDDRDYLEKMDGVEMRRKIRLRTYPPAADFALLEMKQKQGDTQLKRSLKLASADARQIAAGNYTPLLRYRDPFADECFSVMSMLCYRPKTIIEYTREAFVLPQNKTRVTFDRDIRSSEYNAGLFSPDLHPSPVMNPYYVVLEVKYNGFLSEYVRELIGSCDSFLTSSSKYCMGRDVCFL